MTLSGNASTSTSTSASLSTNALVPVKTASSWDRAKLQYVAIPRSTVWQFVGHKLAELKHVSRALRRKRLLDACSRGAVSEVLEQLALGVDVDCRTSQGETPLHLAALHGEAKLLSILLDHGADVAALTYDGESALHLACAKDHLAAVDVLLQHHAKIDLETSDLRAYQPLHIAAELGLLGIAKTLLQHRAKVDAVTRTKQLTPLMLAAQQGFNEMVELLLDRGADPDMEDLEGNTPLHFASYGAHYRVTYLLLTAGADPDMPNANDETPGDIAARNRAPHIVRLLASNGMGYGEQPVAILDKMFSSDQQLNISLSKNRAELADVIIRHRVKYDAMYALGSVVEETERDVALEQAARRSSSGSFFRRASLTE